MYSTSIVRYVYDALLKVFVILELYSPGPHSLFIFEKTDLYICQNFTFCDKQKNECHEFGIT